MKTLTNATFLFFVTLSKTTSMSATTAMPAASTKLDFTVNARTDTAIKPSVPILTHATETMILALMLVQPTAMVDTDPSRTPATTAMESNSSRIPWWKQLRRQKTTATVETTATLSGAT